MAIHHWSHGQGNAKGTFSHCRANQAEAKDLPTVQKLETWYAKADNGLLCWLVGIRLTFTDGHQTPVHGSNNSACTHESFELQSGKTITLLNVGTGSDDTFRGMLIITSKDRKVMLGPGYLNAIKLHTVDFHSGVWLGISGGLDNHSTLPNVFGQLGFFFLEDIASFNIVMDFHSEPDPNAIAPELHQVIIETIGRTRGTSPFPSQKQTQSLPPRLRPRKRAGRKTTESRYLSLGASLASEISLPVPVLAGATQRPSPIRHLR